MKLLTPPDRPTGIDLQELAQRGARLRLRLDGPCTDDERKAALAHVRTLVALPEPGTRVLLPGGKAGTVREVFCDESGRGWRVAVLPEGALPYETQVYAPGDVRPNQ